MLKHENLSPLLNPSFQAPAPESQLAVHEADISGTAVDQQGAVSQTAIEQLLEHFDRLPLCSSPVRSNSESEIKH